MSHILHYPVDEPTNVTITATLSDMFDTVCMHDCVIIDLYTYEVMVYDDDARLVATHPVNDET